MWLCRCDCGRMGLYAVGNLRSKRSTRCRACGTKATHATKDASRNKKHLPGHKYWHRMMQAHKQQTCERWHNFNAFIADMNTPPSGTRRLMRLDITKEFCEANCRWATSMQEYADKAGISKCAIWTRIKKGVPFVTATTAKNVKTPNGKRVTYLDKTMCLKEWAAFLGVAYHKFMYEKTKNGTKNAILKFLKAGGKSCSPNGL